MKKKLAAFVVFFALVALAGLLLPTGWLKAQVGGVATVVGGVTPVNQFAPTSATGLGGAVTNPASNFVIQVAGGQVYFAGSVQDMAQSQLTLPASSTNLIVWNAFAQQLYAKQAVTGPGTSGTSVGVPTSLLFADATRGEIPLATVVCNATACGNGGNGSITDNRPLAAFPAGKYVAGHVNQAKSNSDIAGQATLAGNTATVTFANAYQVAPVCVCTDQTTPQLVKCPATTASLIITDTVGATDVVSYACYGNPN